MITAPLSRIIDNPWQTRHAYSEEYIEQLAADIQRNGLMQPPAARLVDSAGAMIDVNRFLHNSQHTISQHTFDEILRTDSTMVQLAFGHNRLRAYRQLCSTTEDFTAFPLHIMPLTDEQMANMAWSENEQRKELTPVEEAMAIQKRMQDFGWTQAQVAEQLGLGRSTIANKLRILKLPQEVLENVAAGQISERQAVALAPMFTEITAEDVELMKDSWWRSPEEIVQQAIDHGISADEIRREVSFSKQRLEQKKESDKKAAEIKKKIEEGGNVIRIRDLNYDDYDSMYAEVEGCSKESCTCWTAAIDYSGDEVSICTNPARRRQLKGKQTKKEKKRRRERVESYRSEFWKTYFSAGFNWTPAAMRLIAEKVIAYGTSAKAMRQSLDELLERGAIDQEQRDVLDGLAGYNERDKALDAIEALPLDTVMVFMIACLTEKVFSEVIEYGHAADAWHKLKKSQPYEA